MISDDLSERLDAYRRAHIRIYHPTLGELLVEPDSSGRTEGEFPAKDAETIHVVTAHNPGRELLANENAIRHAQLEALLAGRPALTAWQAVGGDPKWEHQEASFAIVGLSDHEARSLGSEFGQEAVFAWRVGTLDVVACVTKNVTSSGWRARRIGA